MKTVEKAANSPACVMFIEMHLEDLNLDDDGDSDIKLASDPAIGVRTPCSENATNSMPDQSNILRNCVTQSPMYQESNFSSDVAISPSARNHRKLNAIRRSMEFPSSENHDRSFTETTPVQEATRRGQSNPYRDALHAPSSALTTMTNSYPGQHTKSSTNSQHPLLRDSEYWKAITLEIQLQQSSATATPKSAPSSSPPLLLQLLTQMHSTLLTLLPPQQRSLVGESLTAEVPISQISNHTFSITDLSEQLTALLLTSCAPFRDRRLLSLLAALRGSADPSCPQTIAWALRSWTGVMEMMKSVSRNTSIEFPLLYSPCSLRFLTTYLPFYPRLSRTSTISPNPLTPSPYPYLSSTSPSKVKHS